MIAMPISMPKGCNDCPCWYDGWCSLLCQINNNTESLPDEYAYSREKRSPDCPLIILEAEKDDQTTQAPTDQEDHSVP